MDIDVLFLSHAVVSYHSFLCHLTNGRSDRLLYIYRVVHAIDAVLLPPWETIVDATRASPDHTVLASALETIGTASGFLNGIGNFTVFAPTDMAFGELPDLDRLQSEEFLLHLIDLLFYHIIGGGVVSADLEVGLSAPTVNGENVTVTSLDPPMVNNATIVQADLMVDNGVIHVTDAVLLPRKSQPTHTAFSLLLCRPILWNCLFDDANANK